MLLGKIGADQRVPLYRYFSTSARGGFIGPLTIDDVPEGHYQIYFGTDDNDDGIFDSPSATFVEIDIPCHDIPREETVQPQLSPPTSQQTDPAGADSLPQLGIGSTWTDLCNLVRNALYNSCDTYVNSDGSLSARGLHAVECIRNGLILAGTGKPIIFFLLRSINHG